LDTKKIIAGATLLTLGGALLGGVIGYNLYEPKTVVITETKEVVKTQLVEVEKEVQIPVEVIKEVPVDNGNLQLLLQYGYDNEGDLSGVYDDLKDTEIDQVVNRIVFINDAKAIALNEVKKGILEELHKSEVTMSSGSIVKLYKSDIKRLKFNEDTLDIVVVEKDFDDKDAEVKVTGRFEQENDKFNFEAIVLIKDGAFDEIETVSISERI